MARAPKKRGPAGSGGPAGPVSPRSRVSLLMRRFTVPPALNDPDRRVEWDLPAAEDKPGDYMIELNLSYASGVQGAVERFKELHDALLGEEARARPALLVSKSYFKCRLSVQEWRELVKRDEQQAREQAAAQAAADPTKKPAHGAGNWRTIYKVWPDFPIRATLDRSVATVKADAALRAFAAGGEKIVWAVIDSGVEASHPHFQTYDTLGATEVAQVHRDFTGGQVADAGTIATALKDDFGHGTHVAGIIAGGLPTKFEPGADFQVYENTYEAGSEDTQAGPSLKTRSPSKESLRGVAMLCNLVSLKVLDANGAGRASDVIRALAYIREELNGDPKLLRVHGVNLSVGYEFDAEMFACGQSPICVEVDRLVKAGVVVVTAAGNTGYGQLPAQERPTRIGLSNTINDPGNAALAITVGATHRDSPHTYGVSYFSSKGPTGDGRLKPDLVAPGERITSCAVGRYLAGNGGDVPDKLPAYIDESGTSMAAPHVSGAVAAFLSVRREFIQRPEEVKRIFLDSATSLGRERYFEGHGLVDLMRAIQSV